MDTMIKLRTPKQIWMRERLERAAWRLADILAILAVLYIASQTLHAEPLGRTGTALVAATAIDLGSTAYGLSRCARCAEGNPMLAGRFPVIAAKSAAYTVGFLLLDRKLHSQRTTKWIKVALVGAHLVAAGNNFRIARAK